ncbi:MULTISPECIES: DUF190 domain-containing protein [Aeromonas]|uniref:DUF190 domain-containing protein n=1 Tax=Aeromonas TaxID=642 RepID=UPI0016036F21|nr:MULTISPECIES: DUF190 domain-containing protein [Aeromonas]
MKGYQLTFYTRQDRSIQGQPLTQWLVEQAKNLGIQGATLLAANEGLGHDRRLHSAHFFELSDQPLEVTLAVTESEVNLMFDALKNNNTSVFYTLIPIEFGMSGERDSDN